MIPYTDIPPADTFWYLASPYSKYPNNIADAYETVSGVAAKLIESGLDVFCPIAYSHPIALHGDLDPLDHKLWMRLDQPFMDAASGLLVCMMPGWEESIGVAYEIEQFKVAGKPVHYLEVDVESI